jgi:hypothetical protein
VCDMITPRSQAESKQRAQYARVVDKLPSALAQRGARGVAGVTLRCVVFN